MAVRFIADSHSYQSVTESEAIEWVSVTSLVGQFKPAFDPKTMSSKSSKNKKSKWYGMSPEEIQQVWKNETNRALGLGTWYHNQREEDLCSLDTLERRGKIVPIIKPLIIDGIKYAPEQKLSDGVYPEHLAYLKSAGLCGQSDLVEVVDGYVDITDYKTNKEIKTEGYKNWEGIVSKMNGPLSHLDDCNLMHYNVQLSLYMYMILRHNPKLKPGKITIHHILFESEGEDKYGYPITKLDMDGQPVLKAVVPYELPYMKAECIAIVNWLRDNRDKLKKK
jgi:hypothetical protein